MKAPLSWLKEFVDIDCTVEKLEEKLFSPSRPQTGKITSYSMNGSGSRPGP